MDIYEFIEGPLLWFSGLFLLIAILVRLVLFTVSIIRIRKNSKNESRIGAELIARLFIPYHKGVARKPFYAILRYCFHAMMLIVPIWLGGHIDLWYESRFEWEWAALPDLTADYMTLMVVALACYFVMRRLLQKQIRRQSSIYDYIIIVVTALPFITGYFLTHGTLDKIAFFDDNIFSIHVITSEAMMMMAAFLFIRTRINTEICTGCAACEVYCPSGSLEIKESGSKRTFTHSHYRCISCASCVVSCPESASSLRHELSLRNLFSMLGKKEIRNVDLKACGSCGALYAPEPLLKRVGKILDEEYPLICHKCRREELGKQLKDVIAQH